MLRPVRRSHDRLYAPTVTLTPFMAGEAPYVG